MSRPHHTLYAIGKVEKAFGVQGEVIVRPMTGPPARFRKLKQAYLGRQESETRPMSVEHARVDARGVRLKFREAPDRTRAEALAGCLIFVTEEEVVLPRKGSHFIHDVIGMRVLDERDTPVGVVKDVLRLPAQDVYVIEQDGREWMLPAVREFVTSIDVASKTMTVRLIEGLMNP